MKLWKKISLICISVMILVVTISYSGLMIYTEKQLVNNETEYQSQALIEKSKSFLDLFYINILETDNEVVAKSLAQYAFSKTASDNMILYYDGELIYSNFSFSPMDYCGSDSSCQVKVDGTEILILKASNALELEYTQDSRFEIYMVTDIEDIYKDLHSIFTGFLFANIAIVLIGIIIIIYLVKISLTPLKKLEEGTKIIASGDYSKRIEVIKQDEVGNLSMNFNKMTDEVEENILALTERIDRQRLFIGAVSHEYKTPITAMLLHIDMLQNMYMNEENKGKSLEILESQCKWLEELTGKLLKIVSVNEKITKGEHDLVDLFAKVENSTKALLAEKNITLLIKTQPIKINFDMDLIHSAVVNLIVNSSRASKENQEIHLIGNENSITVKDFGKGMKSEEIERITEPFYMVDKSRSKKTGGFGLGLALVNEIVKAHDGELMIESVEGVGTIITIIFP